MVPPFEFPRSEIGVLAQLRHNVLLKGRVDLVALGSTGLRFIEVKTGLPKIADVFQLRLYREMALTISPDANISLELWYTNPALPDKIRVRPILPSSTSLLSQLEEIVDLAATITTKTELPARYSNPKYCQSCPYCALIPRLLP